MRLKKFFEEETTMLKKFFAVFMLATALLIVGQSSDAEARRQLVGYYPDNGEPAYLLTETVSRLYVGGGGYQCVITSSSSTLNYRFWREGGGWRYWNSWPASGWVNRIDSPVAYGALSYLLNNY